MPHGAPSSSITCKWSYDVFLSFRGEDTRFSFTSHLHHSLSQAGLRVFLNDELIRSGENITPTLFKAIHESGIAIIVFSENYANSAFCLQELVQILECFEEEGRLIYPVFFGVDPSKVRHQTGSYAEALARLEERFIDKRRQVEKWRLALSQAADLSGYHFLPNTTKEEEFIRAIVESVTARINEKEEEEEEEHDDTIHETTDFSLWEKGKRIGFGAYGIVYVAQHRETGALCAVKELNIRRAENDESIRHEIEILSQLKSHSNIVKYYGHKEDVTGRISLYMEYIQPGSLKKYISERGKLHGSLIQNFTAQILFGLVHLHSNRRVHRDLKPDNLLVDSKNIVKLVDFGLAKLLAESVGKHSVLGTLCYAAPEVLQNKNYQSLHEALAADIWSLGCVIIEMSSGLQPWWPDSDSDSDSDSQHPHIPEELCQGGKDFLKLCFIRKPAKRPSASILLKHPFVKAQADALMEESTRIDGVESC